VRTCRGTGCRAAEFRSRFARDFLVVYPGREDVSAAATISRARHRRRGRPGIRGHSAVTFSRATVGRGRGPSTAETLVRRRSVERQQRASACPQAHLERSYPFAVFASASEGVQRRELERKVNQARFTTRTGFAALRQSARVFGRRRSEARAPAQTGRCSLYSRTARATRAARNSTDARSRTLSVSRVSRKCP